MTGAAERDALLASQKIMERVMEFIAGLSPEQVADLAAGRAGVDLVPVEPAGDTEDD